MQISSIWRGQRPETLPQMATWCARNPRGDLHWGRAISVGKTPEALCAASLRGRCREAPQVLDWEWNGPTLHSRWILPQSSRHRAPVLPFSLGWLFSFLAWLTTCLQTFSRDAIGGSWPRGGELLLKNSLLWLVKNPLGTGNGVVPGWALSFPNYLASSHLGPWHLPFGRSAHSLHISNFVPDHVMSCRAGPVRHLAQDQPWRAVELRLNHTVDSLLSFKNNVCGWREFTMILRVALRRTLVTKGQSELCQNGEPHFFLIAEGWRWVKEPSVFLALLAECGSAWGICRALYCRLLEGLLDCSRQAQHGLELHLPFQARKCSDRLGLRKRAAGWSRQVPCLGSSLFPEKCAWLSFLIPRNHNFHLTVFTKGTYPMSLDTQESRLLIRALLRQAGRQA